jgi:RNA polymerase sigma-70 factor (ECF subfamily)
MNLSHNYLSLRPYLLAIAYNMTSQVHEAEDIVQDTFEDLLKQPVADIKNLKSYLTRIVINKSIDRVTRLKKERETYPGAWLPEPYITESKNDINVDILPYAFLHLLEKLNPIERAVIILREAFNYTYEEVADLCEVSVDNCRQILHRAKPKLKDPVRADVTTTKETERIMRAFLQACLDQDTKQLSAILKEDVQLYSDGGGKATAARNILEGITGVGKFVFGVARKAFSMWSHSKSIFVNGEPAAIMSDENGVYMVLMIETQRDKVATIFTMRNPEKIFYKNLSQNPSLTDLDAK